MKVHEQIKLFRKLKGWSQEDMANKLEMSLNGYGGIERGDADISVTRLEQIAGVFGISLVELFGSNEKNVFNALETNNGIQTNQYYGSANSDYENLQLKYELENQRMLNQQQNKEIDLLKEVIVLMKRESV